MPRKVIVAQHTSDAGTDPHIGGIKAALRAVRPLGVRFSVTDIDGEGTTIAAWIAEPVERTPRTPRSSRRALGAGVPDTNAAGAEQAGAT